MPGGGPQGTLLGVFFFLILINKAGWPKETSPNQFILPSSLETTKARLKYVDDLTFGSTVNLKKSLFFLNLKKSLFFLKKIQTFKINLMT